MNLLALRVLARLLLADGAFVPARDLRVSSTGRSVCQITLKGHMRQLRLAGCMIERQGGGPWLRTLSYRLVCLPPDAVLDDLLVIVRTLRAESERRPAPTPRRAPGWDTAPFVRRSSATGAPSGAARVGASLW